ncbi:MAG: NfeD family protein [Butyricicoccus sp.]|nr:NfeD family protein [Butyricicoccus sp.]
MPFNFSDAIAPLLHLAVDNMPFVWGAAALLFLALEAVTVGLASIWFAIGSVCALIAALLGAPLWLQALWFALISALTLLLTRPLAKKFINGRSEATNADRVIGADCRVVERIDNLAGTGAVSADGKVWTARTVDGSVVEPGAVVRVLEIRGVKLIVTLPPEWESLRR